jgi:hypothetical protein
MRSSEICVEAKAGTVGLSPGGKFVGLVRDSVMASEQTSKTTVEIPQDTRKGEGD